jgi:uroporphyrinogen-III decarboxylase
MDALVRREQSPEGEVATWKDGRRLLYRPDDLPELLSDLPPPSSDPEQVPRPLSYIPVSQGLHFDIHPSHRFDVFRQVRSLAGPDVSVHGEVTSPFDYLLDALGHEAALMLLIDDPERAEAWLSNFADGVAEIASAMVCEDIDAIKVSSPFAGAGFLSRGHYERFVLPYERLVVEAIQQSGKPAYLHTCGAISDRLDLMARSGARGLECLDPPPLGTAELPEAFEVLGGRMFVKGNVDSVHALLLGTDDLVAQDAAARLRLGKAYGRFILSTACSIAPAVRPERIMMLRQIVEEQG